MDRRWAFLQAAILLGFMLFGVWAIQGGDAQLRQVAIPDEELYREIVARVRHGEDYHDVATELMPKARSLFNFRLPTYAWLLALAPDDQWAAKWCHVGFGLLVTLAAAWALLSNAALWECLIALPWLLGSTIAWSFYSDAYLTTEVWAALLILASLAAYAREHWIAGAIFAIIATLMRELALPVVVVALGFACWRRHWREVVLLGIGLAAFAGFLFWHALEVRWRLPQAEGSNVAQWLLSPSYRFALETARMCVFVWPLSGWVSALLVPLGFYGLWSWRVIAGQRIFWTAACFAFSFWIVRGGDYWGLLYTPLLAFGFARAGPALRELARSIMRNDDAAKTRTAEADGGGS